MWSYNRSLYFENELYHHGIKGMKWGVRRFQTKSGKLTVAGKKRYNSEKEYRDKLTKIANNKNVNESDLKRINYRNQSLGKRVVKTAASGVAQMLISEVLSGNASRWARMNKAQIASELTKKALSLAGTTAANVAIQDRLAKSASNKYTKSGSRKKGVKDHAITKEDAISLGINLATTVAPGLAMIAGTNMATARAKRQANEAAFYSKWGNRILSESVDNIVWQSDDLKYAIIDNRNRR